MKIICTGSEQKVEMADMSFILGVIGAILSTKSIHPIRTAFNIVVSYKCKCGFRFHIVDCSITLRNWTVM